MFRRRDRRSAKRARKAASLYRVIIQGSSRFQMLVSPLKTYGCNAMYKDGACGTGSFDRRLRFMNEAPTNYRRHRAAFEVAPVERRIARFAGGLGSSESPGAVQRKNREIGGLAGRDCALQAK